MGKFTNRNLISGETVIFETHYHWVKYFSLEGLISLFLIPLIEVYTSEFVVTNQRILFKTGWLNIDVVEIKHEALEAVIIKQPIIGRIFGYGTLRIIGSGGTTEVYRNIHKPLEFRKKCLEAGLNH